jgi:hypothetical protein
VGKWGEAGRGALRDKVFYEGIRENPCELRRGQNGASRVLIGKKMIA